MKHNIKDIYCFLKSKVLNEGVGDELDDMDQNSIAASSDSFLYHFGDFYPTPTDPVGIVVIEDNGVKPLTIMGLTSYDANGNVSWTEQRLTWQEAVEGAKKYSYNGVGGWELPSKEQWEDAFDLTAGNDELSKKKVEFINARIDSWNSGARSYSEMPRWEEFKA